MPTKKDNNKYESDDINLEEEFIDLEENGDDKIEDKIKKLKQDLKACQKEKQDNLLGWQRAQADYVNLKNETEKKRLETAKFASERVIIDLLPVLDSFQMAFSDQEAWNNTPENWRLGIEYIHNQLENILTDHGLKKINALGQDFNPNEHESAGTIKTDKKEEDHKVLEIIKNGFIFRGKIIRPALVKIGSFEKNK